LVAPMDLAIFDGANVHAMRTIAPQPLREHHGIAGPRGALADQRANLTDRYRQRITKLRAVDPDRARLRIAIGPLRAIAAIVVRADLPAESVFTLDDDGFSGIDPEPRFV